MCAYYKGQESIRSLVNYDANLRTTSRDLHVFKVLCVGAGISSPKTREMQVESVWRSTTFALPAG